MPRSIPTNLVSKLRSLDEELERKLKAIKSIAGSTKSSEEDLENLEQGTLAYFKEKEQKLLDNYRERSPLLDKTIEAIEQCQERNPIYDVVDDISKPLRGGRAYLPVIRVNESFPIAVKEMRELTDVYELGNLTKKRYRAYQLFFNPPVLAACGGLLFSVGMKGAETFLGNEIIDSLCGGATGAFFCGFIGWRITDTYIHQVADNVASDVNFLVERLEKMYKK